MIHHLSVPARDPKSVAEFFAALMNGFTIDFPPNPGAYMAIARDGDGTGVEVYPAGTVMLPNGDTGAMFARQSTGPDPRWPTHFALSVDHNADQVVALAKARGWDCFVCDRGGHFHVVEVWVENAWLVEVLPPSYAAEYVGFAREMETMADPNAALSSHQPQAATLERV